MTFIKCIDAVRGGNSFKSSFGAGGISFALPKNRPPRRLRCLGNGYFVCVVGSPSFLLRDCSRSFALLLTLLKSVGTSDWLMDFSMLVAIGYY